MASRVVGGGLSFIVTASLAYGMSSLVQVLGVAVAMLALNRVQAKTSVVGKIFML